MMRTIPFLLLAFALFFVVGCDDGGGTTDDGFDDAEILANFADHVVIPTYTILLDRMKDLQTAVNTLSKDATDTNLDAARDAWIASRRPWEQSEAFIFGPVDSFGYDPAMDSWPLNKTDLDAVLASDDALTAEYVGNLQETQKGFHTAEYLLFGDGGTKTVDDFDDRQFEYLIGITDELVRTSDALLTSWTEGINNNEPFRDTFASAGKDGNTVYPSKHAAIQEIVGGMDAICDEVANGKIADPYDAHDPILVESQFAYNSLRDFQDNIRSVQNAYLGGVPLAGTTGRGLSDYVKEHDAELDTRLQAEIQTAIDTIGQIPEPFRNSISDPSAYDAIEAAQAAVRVVQNTLNDEIMTLLLQ